MRRISRKCLAWFRIGSPVLRFLIRVDFSRQIRIQEVKNDPQNIEKSEEISCFEVLDVLF
jgi:hypothetical protein